jgi:hypothetical protein
MHVAKPASSSSAPSSSAHHQTTFRQTATWLVGSFSLGLFLGLSLGWRLHRRALQFSADERKKYSDRY